MRRGAQRTSVLIAAVVIAAGCLPPLPPDAGPQPVECSGGETRAVRAGHTSLDFIPIVDGDDLPAWQQPQGGIGTRINVNLGGYGSEEGIASLTTQFLGATGTGVSCGDDEDSDGGTADAGACGDLEICDNGECRQLLANQTNVRFPLKCLEDETLHIPEMSVRFGNRFPLAELNGVAQELRLTAVPHTGEPMTSSVQVVLRVGDFVFPSWWETDPP